MATNSAIEWTEATWNPIVGCSILSPGCTNCYAMKMAARIQKMNRTGGSNSDYVNHYDGTTRSVNGNVVWTGKLAKAPRKLFDLPLSRKKPTTFFVNSMGDLFHEYVPNEWIDEVFAVMALAPQHTFQILTKRAKRMRDWFTRREGQYSNGAQLAVYHKLAGVGSMAPPRGFGLEASDVAACMARVIEPKGWPLPNVWLGVSAERQQEADERIPLLLDTPAAVRFVSAEPLLGHIALHALNLGTPAPSDALRGMRCVPDASAQGFHNEPTAKLDWVIVGGESGPRARPSHPQWSRDLRDWCLATGVQFFFKQWGAWKPLDQFAEQVIDSAGKHAVVREDGRFVVDHDLAQPPEAVFTFNMGKKAAGRLLDGVEHNGFPTRGLVDGI
jgi:protein gp37